MIEMSPFARLAQLYENSLRKPELWQIRQEELQPWVFKYRPLEPYGPTWHFNEVWVGQTSNGNATMRAKILNVASGDAYLDGMLWVENGKFLIPPTFDITEAGITNLTIFPVYTFGERSEEQSQTRTFSDETNQSHRDLLSKLMVDWILDCVNQNRLLLPPEVNRIVR